MWIRHLTQNLGVNLAGVRVLFELEERLGTRILERLYTEASDEHDRANPATEEAPSTPAPTVAPAASREPTPA
jgi:hypothetical protein